MISRNSTNETTDNALEKRNRPVPPRYRRYTDIFEEPENILSK